MSAPKLALPGLIDHQGLLTGIHLSVVSCMSAGSIAWTRHRWDYCGKCGLPRKHAQSLADVYKCRNRLHGLCGDISPHLFGIKSAMSMRLGLWGALGLKIFGSQCRPLITLCKLQRCKQWIKICDTIRLYCFMLEAGLHTVVEEKEKQESKHNTKKQTWCNLVCWTILLAGGETDCRWKRTPCEVPFPCTKTATPQLTLLVISSTQVLLPSGEKAVRQETI